MSDALVDILMSTYNEERAVGDCLDAIFTQNTPVAVTVVDGGSRDGTVSILENRARLDPRLTIVADGIHRTLPAALNLALTMTSRPYVAKVDARTFLAPDFIERAVSVLASDDGIACAGGAPQQFGDTLFGAGLAKARTSRFGVGGSQYADLRSRADVDTIQCGVYRRSALNAVGAFDPELQYGEDEELNWRLRSAGWRLVRDASIRFRYQTRSSWKEAFVQYRNYGRARIAVARRHPEFARPYHFAPAAALLTATGLALAAPFSPAALELLAAGTGTYAAGSLIAAIAAAGSQPSTIAATAIAFSALHIGYGLGTLDGVLNMLPARNKLTAPQRTAPTATSGSDHPNIPSTTG
jgi:succinoglycan biosynthesis protein ExoA